MMLHSTDAFRGDVLYKDTYTFYQASPSVQLVQDTATCIAMSSTPNRTQRGTRSIGPLPAYWTSCPPMTSTPRSLAAPTSSLSKANTQMAFSPSPLPASQVTSLIFPEISPPSQGSGSTPFERQFVDGFSREWINIDTRISPVTRSNPLSVFFSPTCSSAGGTPRTERTPSQASQGRISLLDRFRSAAADESANTEHYIPLSSFSPQRPSSPLSDLSDLTPLPSPESSCRFRRGLNSQSNTPFTSPTVERDKDINQPNIQCVLTPGRKAPPSPSTRSSSRPCDSDYLPAKGKRKRVLTSRDGDDIPTSRKKVRATNAPFTEINSSIKTFTQRRLPTNVPYNPQFSLLYLRFPVSSYLRLADGTFPLLSADSKRLTGTYNEPRDALDLYTPRFVRGCGTTKVGVCPICIESPSRGGRNEVVWLSTKFSAYKWHGRIFFHWLKALTGFSYHLQYAHGISSISARPFSPPVAFRLFKRQNPAKNERPSVQEGKCHKCKKWTPVESIKHMDIKVKELYWWKHAAACHQGSHMEGDNDFFLDDDLYQRAQQYSDSDF